MLTVQLLNKFMVSYGDIQMTTCIITLLVHLEHYREDFLLSSIATVVDLSKGNTYLSG